MAITLTTNLYGHLGEHLARKRIDWVSDDIVLTLHGNLYTPDQDGDIWVSDLADELPTAGGYTVGGVAMTTALLAYIAASNTTPLDADDVVIPNTTLSWHYAVISDRTPGTAATQPLIAYLVPATQPVSSTGGDTTVAFNASGITAVNVS